MTTLSIWEKFKLYGPRKFLIYVCMELRRLVKYQLRGGYAQFGEDVMMRPYLPKGSDWIAIDVGCNDPVRFNNTYGLYKRGIRCINIDPIPNCIEKFRLLRPRDTSLNIGIGAGEKVLKFYQRTPDVASSFQPDYDHCSLAKVDAIIDIPVYPLRYIVQKFAPGKEVGFLSVDTEGMELEVLKSHNWVTHRPAVVCVETVGECSKLISFMEERGYGQIAKTAVNTIWADKQRYAECRRHNWPAGVDGVPEL